MKTSTIFVLLCMLLPAGLAVAQEPEFICGTKMSETQNKTTLQPDAAYE